MAEWMLKYADARGEIHQQVAEAGSERELRDRYTQQGFLVYSVKPRSEISGSCHRDQAAPQEAQPREIPDLQPAVRHPDPRRPADSESARPAGRAPHRPQTVAATSRPCAKKCATARCSPTPSRAQGVFPPIYVTTVLAGERSGSLAEVLDRYITYQKLSLAVRKKVLVSLMYPAC